MTPVLRRGLDFFIVRAVIVVYSISYDLSNDKDSDDDDYQHSAADNEYHS